MYGSLKKMTQCLLTVTKVSVAHQELSRRLTAITQWFVDN